MERFNVIGDPSLVVNPINPRVSFAPKGCKTCNYSITGKDELKVVTLYDVMKQCASGEWKSLQKGAHSIHAYKSTRKGYTPFTFDGVVFIDIDKFNKVPELAGWETKIFNSFNELCNLMPNLLACKYSPSGNLHFFVYHKDIKDSREYEQLSKLYMCCLAKAIRHHLGLDLRDYEGALDGHMIATQQLNVNDSEVCWNLMCCHTVLKKQQKEIIKSEYGEWMRPNGNQLHDVDSTIITGDGETVVNEHFFINGWKGYEARTRIAATAYFHFGKDLTKTKEWLASRFKNAAELEKQLISMVSHDKVGNYFVSSIEKQLFGNGESVTIIPDDKYLSDVVDFNLMVNKYYYLNAGTGQGKTELVKGLSKIPGIKIAILQMNKALRDGKKQGIEDITQDNFRWSDIVSKERIHTTVEGFNRNCEDMDLSTYTIIVDEAHLLQDYSAIDGKLKNITKLLEVLPTAKQVIFMSATPKSEVKLFPFEMMKFTKIKNQKLTVTTHPLRYVGRGSKEHARYSCMFGYISSIAGKHIIFSNKHQECWKKYGLKDMDYTWFHSQNVADPKVQSILNDNKLLTDITLATIYLGVGVEIKNEKEVHIWFDLAEGWDKAFIEQSIGRPRDAENIHLHFFYSADSDKREGMFTDEEIEAIENAFEKLVIDIDGTPTVNLIAAKMTGIYDGNFNTYSCKDKVQLLKLGQIVSNRDYFLVHDIALLRQLPYKEFTVRHNDVFLINTDGKEKYNRAEIELKQHLCSRSDHWWMERHHNNTTYEDMLLELTPYFIDKKNARTMLSNCKYVWKNAIGLPAADGFFDSMGVAAGVIADMNNYCNVKAKTMVLEEFVGGEETLESIKMKFKKVEAAFTEEYLEYRIDCILLNQSVIPETIPEFDSMLYDIMGIEIGTPIMKTTKVPYPFKETTWKEVLKKLRNETNKANAKMGGAKKKIVRVQNTVTGEIREFISKGEATKGLGVGTKAFNQFLKGERVVKLLDWKLIN